MIKTLCLILAAAFGPSVSADRRTKTENVVLVTADGGRRQELFGGIDALLTKAGAITARRR